MLACSSFFHGFPWSGNEGLICLINLVVENHTDRATELGFFSTTPEYHLKGDQGLRDCVAEKGLVSLCWVCVGVLEVRLVQVYILLALQWAHQLSIYPFPAPGWLDKPNYVGLADL